MKKLFAVIILVGLLLVLGGQIHNFLNKDGGARQGFSDFQAKLETAKLDQAKLQAELDYYLNPVNLEKELRARFNYRLPDEKLLIIVPRNTSSASSSTAP